MTASDVDTREPDVVVVGAGGDAPALAWRLGQQGIDVLLLEAGPFHGNEQFPEPHSARGNTSSTSPDDLSGDLLDAQFTGREGDMGSPVDGKLRWGPADADRAPWARTVPQTGVISQVAGVGGTTLHYYGNHPRAFVPSVNDQPHWPVDYEELVPYYQHLEAVHPVEPAPTTPKAELFFEGARRAGYDLTTGLNVEDEGYRPFPNAIHQPDGALARDGDYDGDFRDVEGDTLACHEHQGGPHPHGADFERRAKRGSLVSLVPKALDTGHVEIRPNAFATKVLTRSGPGPLEACGVAYRDTWTGRTRRVFADCVVLAAGCIETPRLWLNSGLPDDGWVGRGLTTHHFDFVSGTFDPDTLEEIIGQRAVEPHQGQAAGSRLDVPGKGGIAVNTFAPGITAATMFSESVEGFAFENDTGGEPWDTEGRVVGQRLKDEMSDYRRMLTLICHADDRPRQENGVTLDESTEDEHGPVARIDWSPHPEDDERRRDLARRSAKLLDEAGANHIHRAAAAPIFLHLQSSMALGKVLDSGGEALSVDRLFVADHSALANGVGGANPTHTGQALALRTAEHLADRYFDGVADPIPADPTPATADD
jgi:choline dehydrogenase-like flavoprotein